MTGDRRQTGGRAGDDSPSESSVTTFPGLGLSEKAVAAAGRAGFITPTEVQVRVVPAVLDGLDVVAASETGSGKTASFVLPILDRLAFKATRIQVLALVPTRELCQQVAGVFCELGAGTPLRLVEIFGGSSYKKQRDGIKKKPHVVVGTPGRVLDLLGGRELDFSRIRTLVLDEADRMLDMGFIPQIREILKMVADKRQNLMFSATIPEEVSKFAALCLTNPIKIQVGARARPPRQVIQEAIEVFPRDKEAKIREVLAEEKGSVLIFTSTKVRADGVYRVVKQEGHKSCVIHSDRSQPERRRALTGFKSGGYQIMVATDVASRGLDIDDISLVINYDMPNDPEDYVHRIGRTGRADAPGRALSFVTYRDYTTLRGIERLTGHTFKNLSPPKRSLDRRASLKRKIL